MTNGQTTIHPPASASPFWPADNPAVINHMTLLQGIINRLAGNSASCKAWCIALVAALVSLTGATRIPGIIGIALVPVLIFAFLDASYLAQERAYRTLFNELVEKVRTGNYSMREVFATAATMKRWARISAFLSWSVSPMYLTLLAIGALAYCMGWLELLSPAVPPGK